MRGPRKFRRGGGGVGSKVLTFFLSFFFVEWRGGP